LLKLRLRLIGCRPRLIAAGKSALPLNNAPNFRRSEARRSSFPLGLSSAPFDVPSFGADFPVSGFLWWPDSTSER
jgi:hypothetical protein